MYFKDDINPEDLSNDNQLVKEMVLEHYGMPRRSGRYPWGSGDSPFQSEIDFLSRVGELKKQGLTNMDIAKALGMRNAKELDTQMRAAKHVKKLNEIDTVKSMKSKGHSNVEIGKKLGYGESTIRSMLSSDLEKNKERVETVKHLLKQQTDAKNFLDVGKGTAAALGVTPGVLEEALFLLSGEGYISVPFSINNVTDPRRKLNMTVLVKEDNVFTKDKVSEYSKVYDDPNTADTKLIYSTIYENVGDIKPIMDFHSNDGGKTFEKTHYPSAIDRKRVLVRYVDDEGGEAKDGTLEIREGLKDLSLGENRYSQVRVMVDDKETNEQGYMKGMAFYSKDIPDGYDVVYNTSKPNKGKSMSALKPLKEGDPENPFGATIMAGGQYFYKDEKGEKQLSPINKIKEEGAWEDMSKTLSPQFLSKQPPRLVKIQLNETLKDKVNQYQNIKNIPSEEIKKEMLLSYADDIDGDILSLKAMAMPGQKTLVLLPMTQAKDNECYAPSLPDGEQVALIRYPHGAKFEIPVLTVNNKLAEGKRQYGNVTDAIGITKRSADQLSGADFDGDQVLVIPMSTETGSMIRAEAMVDDFKNFNHKVLYERTSESGPKYETDYIYKEMGVVSNLITDMTVAGASTDEIVRAIKYSMVTIDSVKPDSQLDVRKAREDFGVEGLKRKYQARIDPETGVVRYGAGTLISRKGTPVSVPERRGAGIIDRETGVKNYGHTGRMYDIIKKPAGSTIISENKTDGTITIELKNGKQKTIPKIVETKPAEQTVKMFSTVGTNESDVKSFFEYSTHRGVEDYYAAYADELMKLRNNVRKEAVGIRAVPVNKEATLEYSSEISALLNKLTRAEAMAPAERRAQAIANEIVMSKEERIKKNKADLLAKQLEDPYFDRNYEVSKDDMKKIKQRAIAKARMIVGLNREDYEINPTEREWEAIIKHAIPSTTITKILNYMSQDTIRDFTSKVNETNLTVGKLNMAKSRLRSGYTLEEVADSLGISTTTLQRKMKGE